MSGMPTLRSRKLEIAYNIPVSKTLRFWEGLKEGKIYATKCCSCGKLYFPPVADCGRCYSPSMEWIQLSGEGELETFTHVNVKPASFQDEAIAKLKEGVRVLARMTGIEEKSVKVGLKVKLFAKITPDGRAMYEFKPI
jgi:uncharacterized OB-fold protein